MTDASTTEEISAVKECPTCGRCFQATVTFCTEDGTPLSLTTARDPLVGTVVQERFRIEERIGQGGMGAVYRATQLPVDRPVALKLLHPHLMGDGRVAQRFLTEARAISRLANPHTVTLFDFGQTADGMLFMALEYLHGVDLGNHLRKEGPLSVAESVRIADAVAQSLAEAHSSDVVHRDLKPANVFLAKTADHPAFVKVLDFGIAQTAGPGGRVTLTGQVAGTPAYMAPESVTGQSQDARVDVYALGVMLYEMITGKVPFDGETTIDVMMQHLEAEPAPMELVNPDAHVPYPLVAFIWQCLSKSPDRRPADATAFRRDLAEAVEAPTSLELHKVRHDPNTAAEFDYDRSAVRSAIAVSDEVLRPTNDPETRGGRWLWPSIAAVVVVAVALGVFKLSQEPSESPKADGVVTPLVEPETPAVQPLEPAPAVVVVKRPPPRALEHPAARRARRGAVVVATAPPVGTAQEAAPVAETVVVTVVSRTVATVVLNGEPDGKTPIQLKLTKSDEPVQIACRRTGYHGDKLSVVPDSDKIATCKLRRKKPSEALPD